MWQPGFHTRTQITWLLFRIRDETSVPVVCFSLSDLYICCSLPLGRTSSQVTSWGSSRTVMAGRNSGSFSPTSACSSTRLTRSAGASWDVISVKNKPFQTCNWGSESVSISVCRMTSRWPASPCSATRSAPLKSPTASTRSTSSNCSSSPMFTFSGRRASTPLKGMWLVCSPQSAVAHFRALKSCSNSFQTASAVVSPQMDGGDQKCGQHYGPDEPAHTQRRSRGDKRKLNQTSCIWRLGLQDIMKLSALALTAAFRWSERSDGDNWRLKDAASLSVNVSQLKDLILMVCAFFFLINDVNDSICSCIQDIMKGRHVYFDQFFFFFFCMCSAQLFMYTDGKYCNMGPTPKQRV